MVKKRSTRLCEVHSLTLHTQTPTSTALTNEALRTELRRYNCPTSAEEMLQNTAIHRLKGGRNPTTRLDCVWNVMAHAQKPDFVFRRVHLNRRGRPFSRLLAAEVCASAVVILDTQCSEVVWRLLATYSIRQFPLHFPSCALPCAITFQLGST